MLAGFIDTQEVNHLTRPGAGPMTTSQAIERLQQLEKEHGPVEVYFDCPACGKSFTPNTVVGLAVHMTQKEQAVK